VVAEVADPGGVELPVDAVELDLNPWWWSACCESPIAGAPRFSGV
jgi:hypothetical protein